jgi:hypothetical protein
MASSQAKRQRTDHPDEEQHAQQWVKLQADNYEAIVQISSIEPHFDGPLGTLVQMELQKGLLEPAVRLNCGPDVAKEMVDAIRQVRLLCLCRLAT